MRRLLCLLFLTCAAALPRSIRAADLKLEARVILGSNEDQKPAQYEPLDAGLADKLHRSFKWKNYYTATNIATAIPVNQTGDIQVSETRAIRVKYLGSSRVEVSCLGHGTPVYKGSYTLEPPEWLVLGGDEKGNSAWFVALRAQDKTPAETARVGQRN